MTSYVPEIFRHRNKLAEDREDKWKDKSRMCSTTIRPLRDSYAVVNGRRYQRYLHLMIKSPRS